jgi:hypothetical protein
MTPYEMLAQYGQESLLRPTDTSQNMVALEKLRKHIGSTVPTQEQRENQGLGMALAAAADTWTGSNLSPLMAAKPQDPEYDRLLKLSQLDQYARQTQLMDTNAQRNLLLGLLKIQDKANKGRKLTHSDFEDLASIDLALEGLQEMEGAMQDPTQEERFLGGKSLSSFELTAPEEFVRGKKKFGEGFGRRRKKGMTPREQSQFERFVAKGGERFEDIQKHTAEWKNTLLKEREAIISGKAPPLGDVANQITGFIEAEKARRTSGK